MFLEYEGERTISSVFTTVNQNKASVALDLKREQAIQDLKKLLKDADVFLCNVRSTGLERLGLDYDSIKSEFPHLVYCHLSAWVSNSKEARAHRCSALLTDNIYE